MEEGVGDEIRLILTHGLSLIRISATDVKMKIVHYFLKAHFKYPDCTINLIQLHQLC